MACYAGTIICEVSNASPRPYVPSSFRCAVFDSLHCLSHPGIRATQKLITERFVWPNINKDVRQWARTCQRGQESKIHRHVSAPLGTFFPPNARFDHLHIDIVGPLPLSQNFRYLFTIIDRFTRWPAAIPLPEITAESIASAFVTNWLANFGIPSTVTTDRGSQFESFLFSLITSTFRIQRNRTTAYHPISNGMIKRFHRQLKSSLKAYNNPNKWSEILPLILFGIRNILKADLQCTPSQLVYGTTLRLPGQSFSPSSTTDLDRTIYADRLQDMRQLSPISPRTQQRQSHFPNDLQACSHVFIRTDSVRKPMHPPPLHRTLKSHCSQRQIFHPQHKWKRTEHQHRSIKTSTPRYRDYASRYRKDTEQSRYFSSYTNSTFSLQNNAFRKNCSLPRKT